MSEARDRGGREVPAESEDAARAVSEPDDAVSEALDRGGREVPAESEDAVRAGDEPDDAPSEAPEPVDHTPEPGDETWSVEADETGPAARVLPTGTDQERETAVEAASLAAQRGELVVLPTDTVYGVAADAFDAAAVQSLLDAKGRGREMPPPVLVSSATTLDALAVGIPAYARALIDAFWPGPLTLVCTHQPSLQWDLGETRGTVAVRMPDHDVALEILERTGPLAVSSANRTGMPAATDAAQAAAMLGEKVSVIVDAGESPGSQASTIVDVRGQRGRVLRRGVLSVERLNEVLEPLGAAIVDEG